MKCPFCEKEWVKSDLSPRRTASRVEVPGWQGREVKKCEDCGKVTRSGSGFCCRCSYARKHGAKREEKRLTIQELLAKGRL